MVILVNGNRFDTMACAMAWAKRLGVQVEIRSDEWLERLREEYEFDRRVIEITDDYEYICEIEGKYYFDSIDAEKALAKTDKYRPLGLYELEM